MPLVEVEVAAMLQSQIGSTRQYQWQIGVAMAVSITHATAEQCHGGPEHRSTIQVLSFRKSREEVPELFDGKGVVIRKLFHVAGIAAVVAELMSGFRNADFRDGESISFTSQTECSDSSHICLEGQHQQVVDRAEVVSGLGLRNVTIGAFAVCLGNSRQRCIQPCIRAAGPNFGLPHRAEILFQSPAVGGAHFCFETSYFRQIVIQHAGFSSQGLPLHGCATFGSFKQRGKNLAAATLCGQLHAVGSPGQ